jgi:hypothetical protein
MQAVFGVRFDNNRYYPAVSLNPAVDHQGSAPGEPNYPATKKQSEGVHSRKSAIYYF